MIWPIPVRMALTITGLVSTTLSFLLPAPVGFWLLTAGLPVFLLGFLDFIDTLQMIQNFTLAAVALLAPLGVLWACIAFQDQTANPWRSALMINLYAFLGAGFATVLSRELTIRGSQVQHILRQFFTSLLGQKKP